MKILIAMNVERRRKSREVGCLNSAEMVMESVELERDNNKHVCHTWVLQHSHSQINFFPNDVKRGLLYGEREFSFLLLLFIIIPYFWVREGKIRTLKFEVLEEFSFYYKLGK